MFANFAKLAVASLVAFSSLSAGTAEAAPPRPERRELRQDARIGHGLATGQLTIGEAARLEAQQAHIDHMERRARRDGYVGPVESARIERTQDRASRDIYRMKHNRRAR